MVLEDTQVWGFWVQGLGFGVLNVGFIAFFSVFFGVYRFTLGKVSPDLRVMGT